MKDHYPLYLAGRPSEPNKDLAVTSKFDGRVAAKVPLADSATIDRALAAGVKARDACRAMPAHARSAVLRHVQSELTSRKEEFARVLAIEAGKPIRDARGEVQRAIETFRIASEEATRIRGEYLPLDDAPRTEAYEAISRRVPIGLCSFISPFNFPLNLVAHKVAPAIAIGCPWVLKPASLTPISALMLGEILADSDLPEGAFSILPCRRDDAELFTIDPRIKLLSFTGSPDVGWDLKNRAGKKGVILELGGNAACIVHRDADLDFAIGRLIVGTFYQSGQSCISVQRILIHRSIYADVRDHLIAEAAKLKSGDPLGEDTFLGPMISEAEARRVEQWVAAAVDAGAKILCGGRRHGNFFDATLLENVAREQKVSCREVFGPVAVLAAYDDFAEACRWVNDSDYGLQAGVFTRDLDAAHHAFNELEVGAVIINDVPSFRADAMPYGGVKDSGLGREGLRSAIEHMSELRLMVLHRAGRRLR